jgi:hypothetical protein
MTRSRILLGVGSLCIVLGGCATHRVATTDIDAIDLAATDAGSATAADGQLTVDTPIGKICDNPRGRAALDRNLPELRKNPNYFLFQGFSLRQLASMSGGRISQAKLDSVQVDLASKPSAQGAAGGAH